MQKLIVLLLISVFITFTSLAQDTKNTWELGIGLGLTKFGESDASYIGDKYGFQIPRLNLTVPINQRLSVDGALSFNTIDNIGFIENSIKYLSFDGSLRYNFDAILNNVYPFVFAGASLVDSERKMTPTINVGGGATYWFSDKWGLSSQIYYKHSFENYESMRSHIQGTIGLVYSFNFGFKSGNSQPCFD